MGAAELTASLPGFEDGPVAGSKAVILPLRFGDAAQAYGARECRCDRAEVFEIACSYFHT